MKFLRLSRVKNGRKSYYTFEEVINDGGNPLDTNPTRLKYSWGKDINTGVARYRRITNWTRMINIYTEKGYIHDIDYLKELDNLEEKLKNN